MEPSIFILAAGMGSRYGGLKQLDAIGPNSESLLQYSIFDAIEAGFKKIVFVIRQEFENEFKAKVTDILPDNISIEFVYQEVNNIPSKFVFPNERTKPWGTGHAVIMAQHTINEPFGIINADDYYGKDAFKKLYRFLADPNLAEDDFCMVGYELQKTLSENGTVSRGICKTDSNQFLREVDECKKIGRTNSTIKDMERNIEFNGNELVSMNMWGVTPLIFKHLNQMFEEFLNNNLAELKEEFFLPIAINSLIESKTITLKVLNSADSWFGITYREDKQMVQEEILKLVEKGGYPDKLWK